MAQKFSDNDILDLNQEWSRDENDAQKRPFSNRAVQGFLKKQIRSKVGYPFLDGDVLNFFADEESMIAYYANPEENADLLLRRIPLEIGSTQYRVRLVNLMDTRTFTIARGSLCPLSFKFTSEFKEFGEEVWQDNDERGLVDVFVRNGVGTYTKVVDGMPVAMGETVTLNVSPYLAIGANTIMIKATGENTERQATAITYTVNLSSLGITSNFSWWNIFFANKPYSVDGLYITGNVEKTLHLKVMGNGYEEEYSQALGATTYTESAFNFGGLNFPTNGNGIYSLSLWLTTDDGTISTEVLSYEIICIDESAADNNRYCAINNRVDKAVNYATKNLFDYVVYNGTASTLPIDITWKGTIDGVETQSTYNVLASTASKMSFAPSLEYETLDNTDFEMTASIFDNNQNMLASTAFSVDNSAGYSAQSGAVINISSKNRSNLASNHTDIINLVDNNVIPSTWSGMAWAKVDGYVTDEKGAPTLRMLNGSRLNLDYRPLQNWTNGDALTFEVCLAIRNVQDYSLPVFKMVDANNIGLTIYPNKIVLMSRNRQTESSQAININDEEKLHFTIALMPNIYGNVGTHIAKIYINGRPNREFAYDDYDSWNTSASIEIGSNGADVDFYGIRAYNVALSSDAVVRNKVNWLDTTAEKQSVTSKNDVVENSEVELDKVKGKYNYFVVKVRDGSNPPSYLQESDVASNVAFHFAEHPDWDVTVEDVKHRYQGTSSKDYFRWNWRFDGKDSTIVKYADGTQTTGKNMKFGKEHTEKINKLTAKKNFASSMHSHKMGSVEAFNDLFGECGLANEANARVAIWQYPFVGFLETTDDNGNPRYEFCGLYTIGPDKGNKATFGYDDSKYPEYISIEGSDNGPMMSNFRKPWDTEKGYIYYSATDEAIVYRNGTSKTLCWDYDAGAYDSSEQTNCENLLRTHWMPTYNFVYECGIKMKPFNGTLEQLNNKYKTQSPTDADAVDPNYEYWCTDYCLYYYEAAEGQFINASANGSAMNLKTQLGITDSQLSGKTLDQKNEIFKAARIQRFKNGIGEHFDINDTIFHRNFVEFFAATDNRTKNTYPYRLDGKWRWRQDDLDTIFDITNIGLQDKDYFCEIQDEGVWNGTENMFWNLIDLAFADEIREQMSVFVSAMASLGGTGRNAVERCYNFFKKYYWQKAQEYFSDVLYNADAKWTYETAYFNTSYNLRSSALSQSLGDHYSAEQSWVAKRIVYMMSKYECGIFNQHNADSIIFRYNANELVDYHLTPAIEMYPVVANGDSTARGERTPEGQECVIQVQGTVDQDIKIQGASYLRSVGDMHTLAIKSGTTMSVHAARLRELILGSKTDASNIRVGASAITIDECKSLRKILLSNVSSLSETLNLEDCVLLEEVYADGTGISVIKLPNGGNLNKIEYGASTNRITLQNLARLTDEGLDMTACLGRVLSMMIEGCDNLSTLSLIYDNYSADGSSLKYIRAVGIQEEGNDNTLNMLYDFTEGRYFGMTDTGIDNDNSLPVIEGNLHFTEFMEAYEAFFKECYPNLHITYDRKVNPSVVEINLQMEEGNVSVKENEIEGGIPTHVTTANKLLKGVDWSATGGTIDANGVVDTSDYPLQNNDTKDTNVVVTATSKWNAQARVSRTITIQSVGMTAIELSSNASGIPNVGDVVDLAVVANSDTTKPLSFIQFSLNDPSLATLVDNGNGTARLTIISEEAKELVVTASNRYASTIKDEVSWVVNDMIIIDANRTDSEEMAANDRALMNVIYAQGWSASADQMYKSEAGKVTSIGTAFRNNTDITDMSAYKYFDRETSPSYSYNNAGSFSGCTSLTTITLPKNIWTSGNANKTSLDRNGFIKGLSSLTELKFSGNPLYIPNNAICYCGNLVLEDLPNTIQIIGAWAFKNDSKIALTKLPEDLVYIGYNDSSDGFKGQSFYGCSNLRITEIPQNVMHIGPQSFEGCTLLTKLKLSCVEVPTLYNTNAFPTSTILYVSNDMLSAYASASNWSTLYNAGRIKPMSEYTE